MNEKIKAAEDALTDLEERDDLAANRCGSIPPDEPHPDEVRRECAAMRKGLAQQIRETKEDLERLRYCQATLQPRLIGAEQELGAADIRLDEAIKNLRVLEAEPDIPQQVMDSWNIQGEVALKDREIFRCGRDQIASLIRECADGRRPAEIESLLEKVERERETGNKYHRFLQKVQLWFNVRQTKPTAPGYYYPVAGRVPESATNFDSILAKLDRNPAGDRKQLYNAARGRSPAEVAELRRAAIGGGIYIGLPPQEKPQEENDCVVRAISNATGVKYDEVRGIAEEGIRFARAEKLGEKIIHYTDAETYCMNRKPELALRYRGMRADQTILTAQYFGAVQNVVFGDFAKALAQTGLPILVRIDIGGGHAVVVNGVFQHNSKVYIATVDSNMGASGNVVFWEAEKFAGVLTGEGSIVYRRGYQQKK